MSNNTNPWLVKLKPLNSYYFGGERSFGFGEKQNYLVHSRRWPQQTTLLGMIRYLLLREQQLLARPGHTVDPKAAYLIGDHSFRLDADANNYGEAMDFGKIHQIGPVCLMDGDTVFVPAPLNAGKPLKQPAGEPALAHTITSQGYRKIPSHFLGGYDPKAGLSASVINPASGTIIPESEVFLPVEQVGIEKSRKGQPKSEAFYKQTSLTFSTKNDRNWHFAFEVVLDEHISLPENTTIPIGGEQRLFQMTATKANLEVPDWTQEKTPSDEPRLVLMSDALVPASIYDHCRFSVTETLDFRFLETSVTHTSRYNNIGDSSRNTDLIKSRKFTLLKKGSVLYPSELDQLERAFQLPRLLQIGYNQYTILNS